MSLALGIILSMSIGDFNNMKCSQCQTPISFTESRKKLSCKHCGAALEAKNWTQVVLISVLFISIFVFPIMSYFTEERLVRLILDALVATPIFILSLKIFIHYTHVADDI